MCIYCRLFVCLIALRLGNAVESFIGKSFATHEPANRDGFGLSGHHALLVHLADVNLHGCMVFRCDQAVRRGAVYNIMLEYTYRANGENLISLNLPLAGDVKVDNISGVILHFA